MSDYIVRATAANSQIRAFAAVTTDMVETARQAAEQLKEKDGLDVQHWED